MTMMPNTLKMIAAPKFSGAWVCALALLLSASSSWCNEITFKIVKIPDLPLAGRILVSTGEVDSSGNKKWSHLIDISSEGKKTITRDCALGTFFMATVQNIIFTPADESEKGCDPGSSISEIAFAFRQKKYALALDRAITGKDLASIKVSPRVQNWQSELFDAVKGGDTEVALKRSSEIADYLTKTGNSKGALPYRTLNFDLAKTKVSGPGELYFDPDQQKHVLGPNDVEKIKRLQAAKSMEPDGKLNWRTMGYIAKWDYRAVEQ